MSALDESTAEEKGDQKSLVAATKGCCQSPFDRLRDVDCLYGTDGLASRQKVNS